MSDHRVPWPVDILRSLTRLHVGSLAEASKSWTWPDQWNATLYPAPLVSGMNVLMNNLRYHPSHQSSSSSSSSSSSIGDFLSFSQQGADRRPSVDSHSNYAEQHSSSTCSSSSYGESCFGLLNRMSRRGVTVTSRSAIVTPGDQIATPPFRCNNDQGRKTVALASAVVLQ